MVTDDASDEGTDAVTFTVDTTPPTVSITAPEDGWSTEDSSVTITWTCTDVGCGIDHIEISIDGGAHISVGTASERTFDALGSGEHTVLVRAYDSAGNMVSASVAFTVSEGGGISGYVIVGIVLVVVVVAAAAVMLMRRKKSSSPPPPQE